MYKKFYVHEKVFRARNCRRRFIKTLLKNAKRIEALREKCPNTGEYGPEKTPYFDTFHAVKLIWGIQ